MAGYNFNIKSIVDQSVADQANLNEERAINRERYQIQATDDQYAILNSLISQTEDPTEAESQAYRAANAIRYSQIYNMPVADAYLNLDQLNAAQFGEGRYSTPKDWFTATCDAWQQGINQLKRNDIGLKIRISEENGNFKLDDLMAELQAIDAENEQLDDKQSRNWVVNCLKFGAQSAPFTGQAIAMGSLGALLGGGIGAAILGTTYSWEAMRGEEYLQLRQDGASVETAGRVADTVGFANAIVETALGEVMAGVGTVAGKALTKSGTISKQIIDKATKDVLKGMYYGGGWKRAAAVATRTGLEYLAEATEEGIEEVVQELVSSYGRSLAASLDEYEEDPSVRAELGMRVAESFKGGFMGALILGVSNAAFNARATVSEFKEVDTTAKLSGTEEDFIKKTNESPVFEGMTDEAKLEAQKDIYAKAEPARAKIAEEKRNAALATAETIDVGERTEDTVEDEAAKVVREDAYRTKEGKLNYEETVIDQNDDGSTDNQFLVKGKGKEEYGRIIYNENGDNITITDFTLSPTRENLRHEVFSDFAAKFAGKDIEWETRSAEAAAVKQGLIDQNTRGAKNGLNYYESGKSSRNQQARISLMREIKAARPNATNEELIYDLATVESRAALKGQSIADIYKDRDQLVRNYMTDSERESTINHFMSQGMTREQAEQKVNDNIGGFFSRDSYEKSRRGFIYISKNSNPQTFIHEYLHSIRADFSQEENERAAKAIGVKDANNWTREEEELLVDYFTKWAIEGKTEKPELVPLFKKIANALAAFYNNIVGKLELSPEIVDFFDSLFADPTNALAQAKAALSQMDQEEYNAENVAVEENVNEGIISDDSLLYVERAAAAMDESGNIMLQLIPERYAQNIGRLGDIEAAKKDYANGVSLEKIYDTYKVVLGNTGEWMYETNDRQYIISKGESIDSVLSRTGFDALNMQSFYNLIKSGNNVELAEMGYEQQRQRLQQKIDILNDQYHTLGDLYSAEELYTANPDLKDLRVGFFQSPVNIKSVQVDGGIAFNAYHIRDIDTLKGSIAYEIQLALQKGIVTNVESAKYWNAVVEATRDIDQKKYGYDFMNAVEVIMEQAQDPYNLDAAAAKDRINMSMFERRANAVINEKEKLNDKKLLYSIIGEQGAKALDEAEDKTERIDNLAIAQVMEQEGKDYKTIRLATGWEKGVDDKWRYEIDDLLNRFDLINKVIDFEKKNPKFHELYEKLLRSYEGGPELTEAEWKEYDLLGDEENQLYNKKNVQLKDVMDAPELYIAYPQLKNMEIRFVNDPLNTTKASYISGRELWSDAVVKYIQVNNIPNSINEKEYESILLHELQHAIQDIEGFAEGGNQETVNGSEIAKNINAEFDEIVKDIESTELFKEAFNKRADEYGRDRRGWASHATFAAYEDIGFDYFEADEKRKRRIERLLDKFTVYQSLSGEVEARNVQSRMTLSEAIRRETALRDTEDVAREDQIVLYDGEVSASYEKQKPIVFDYIDDSVNKLEPGKKARLINDLLNNVEYYNEDGVYIAVNHSKIDSKLNEEVEQCKILKSLYDWDVYLLPEFYSNDQTHADIIIVKNGNDIRFVDLKNLETLRPRKVADRYVEGRSQGDDVFIRVKNDLSVQDVFSEIDKTIKNKVKNNFPVEGSLIIAFNQRNEVYDIEIKKDGTTVPSLNNPDSWKPRPIPMVNSTSSRNFASSTDNNILLQTVYHGSPYVIRRPGGQELRGEELGFDHSKMGTGEGAQAYGWGTYVTQVEGIAETYAKKLTQAPGTLYDSIERKKEFIKMRKKSLRDLDNGKYESRIEKNIKELNRDLKAAQKEKNEKDIKFYEDLIETSLSDLNPEAKEKYRKAFNEDIEKTNAEIKELQAEIKRLNKQAANVYTLDIPDDGVDYLQWDRDIDASEIGNKLYNYLIQHNEDGSYAGNASKYLKDELSDVFNLELDGSQIYRNIQAYLGSDKDASLFLSDMGYIGISYPADNLRGGREDGARNFVIFKEDNITVTDWHAKDVEGNILFQYLQEDLDNETLKEAASFSTWEEWYEYAQVMDDEGVVTGAWDAVAEKEWFKSAWEYSQQIYNKITATETVTEPADDLDKQFLDKMKQDGAIEDFMEKIRQYSDMAAGLSNPIDEAEAADFDRITENSSFINDQLQDPVWQSKSLTDSQRKKIMTLMKDAPKVYRGIYADVYNDESMAVSIPDRTAVETFLDLPEEELIKMDRMTPSERRDLIKELEDEEIKTQVLNGTYKMDGGIDRALDVASDEIKKMQAEIDRLNEEYKDALSEIKNQQKKDFIEEYNRLLDMYSQIQDQEAVASKKITDAVKAGEQGASNNTTSGKKGQLQDIQRRMDQLKTLLKGEREAIAVIEKAKARADYQQQLKDKLKQKAIKAEIRRMRNGLVKSITRKVSFKNVYYDDAKQIIAAQDFMNDWLTSGVNQWIGKDTPFLRKVYSEYITDEAKRSEIIDALSKSKHQSKANKAIQLLEDARNGGKTYDDWTADERKTLHVALGQTDWTNALNLESKDKYRREVLHGMYNEDGTLTDAAMDLVEKILPPEMIANIQYKPMAGWTLEEMEALAKIIDDRYVEGKKVLAGMQQQRRNEIESIRDQIEQIVNDTGIVINPDDSDEDKKKKSEKIRKILGMRTQLKGTAAEAEEKASLKDRLMSIDRGTGNARRFARVMDNYSESVFTTNLCFREYMAYDEEMKHLNDRNKYVQKWMADNGLTIDELQQKHTFPGFMDGEDFVVTTDDLLYIYVADQDEMSQAAVMYGNFGTAGEKQDGKRRDDVEDFKGTKWYKARARGRYDTVLKYAQDLIRSSDKLKGFVDLIERDYAQQYDRLNEASITIFNQPVNRVNNYVPLYRQEMSGEENEKKVMLDLQANTTGAPASYVNRGNTINRVKINPLNQKPVELGLFRTWAESSEATEHFIAYGGYVRDLNAIFTAPSAAATREVIASRYGDDANAYIKNYINELANPNKGTQKSTLDKFVHVLRGKTAPAYLAWKTSGVIKQVCTSPWPFMTYVSPAAYLSAMMKFITPFNHMSDLVKEKSVFMANRTIDPIMDLIREAEQKANNKTKAMFAQFNKTGMQGLEWADWISVAPGWYAVYEQEKAAMNKLNNDKTELDDGYISAEEIEKKAVAKADDVVRLTQPSGRKADIAPLFKNSSEVANILLQFQTALNCIYQQVRFDIPYQIKNRQYKQIVGTIIGYTLAGILVNSVVGGYPDDDKLKKAVYYATTQFTDAVPVVGQMTTSIVEKAITGKGQYMNSNLFPVLETLKRTVNELSDGEYRKAAELFGQGIAYSLGLPVSGYKEIKALLGIGDDDGKITVTPEALWGRR